MAIDLKRSPRKIEMMRQIRDYGTEYPQAQLLANLFIDTKASRHRMLQDLVSEGYLHKHVSERGRISYTLTIEGQEALKRLD